MMAGVDAGRWGGSPRELGIPLLAASRTERGGRLARFAVGAESPLFGGHFPGRPLLPGVAQLALVTWALAAGDPRDGRAACRELEGLRLRALVHPGDTLEVRLAGPDERGMLRFDISRGTELVTRGSGRWLDEEAEASSGGKTAATPTPTVPTSLPLASAPGLPHGAPALLVRQVLATAPGEISCGCEIAAAHPLAGAGLAPGYLALEAAAQTAGVLAAAPRVGGEAASPRIGYLVGVRQARLAPTLPAGRPFLASVWLEGSAPPLAIYRFRVEAEGSERAAGILSAYLDG